MFEFMHMTFGQTFQRQKDYILHDLNFAYAYLDVIIIASKSLDQYKQHLKVVQESIQNYGILINPFKYNFGKSEITFLSFTVNKTGVRPPSEKVKAIT